MVPQEPKIELSGSISLIFDQGKWNLVRVSREFGLSEFESSGFYYNTKNFPCAVKLSIRIEPLEWVKSPSAVITDRRSRWGFPKASCEESSTINQYYPARLVYPTWYARKKMGFSVSFRGRLLFHFEITDPNSQFWLLASTLGDSPGSLWASSSF